MDTHVSLEGETQDAPEGGEVERIDPRRCEKIKPDGTRCNGWKVKGTGYCAGHLGLGIAADPGAYAAEGAARSAEVRQARAEDRKRRPIDVYREAVEEHASEFVRIRLAIARDGAATDGDRLRAMEQLETRAMGRPTEHVEVETKTPQSIEEIRAMPAEERRRLLAELAERRRLRVVGDDEATG